MARVCTICTAGEREAIEADLVAGRAVLAIARKFGVSRDSLARHRAKCVREVIENKANDLAFRLVGELSGLHAITRNLLDTAQKAEDVRLGLAAVRESRGNLELLARLTGRFDQVRLDQERPETPQLTWEEFEAMWHKGQRGKK